MHARGRETARSTISPSSSRRRRRRCCQRRISVWSSYRWHARTCVCVWLIYVLHGGVCMSQKRSEQNDATTMHTFLCMFMLHVCVCVSLKSLIMRSRWCTCCNACRTCCAHHRTQSPADKCATTGDAPFARAHTRGDAHACTHAHWPNIYGDCGRNAARWAELRCAHWALLFLNITYMYLYTMYLRVVTCHAYVHVDILYSILYANVWRSCKA